MTTDLLADFGDVLVKHGFTKLEPAVPGLPGRSWIGATGVHALFYEGRVYLQFCNARRNRSCGTPQDLDAALTRLEARRG